MSSSRVSETYRGFTIYYTAPPDRTWSFRPTPDAPLQSYRSAFQARRAINEHLDGSSAVWPRKEQTRSQRPTEPASPKPQARTRERLPEANAGSKLSELMALLDADSHREIRVRLPGSGRTVSVPAFRRTERRWTGELPANFRTVPNKVPVEFEGKPVYPEFAITGRLAARGWSAVWRKNWQGAAFWSDIGVSASVPDAVAKAFHAVARQIGGSGAWDILAWKGKRILFIESKQYGSDKLTANQLRWLDAALQLGVPLTSFAVYEYIA